MHICAVATHSSTISSEYMRLEHAQAPRHNPLELNGWTAAIFPVSLASPFDRKSLLILPFGPETLRNGLAVIGVNSILNSSD